MKRVQQVLEREATITTRISIGIWWSIQEERREPFFSWNTYVTKPKATAWLSRSQALTRGELCHPPLTHLLSKGNKAVWVALITMRNKPFSWRIFLVYFCFTRTLFANTSLLTYFCDIFFSQSFLSEVDNRFGTMNINRERERERETEQREQAPGCSWNKKREKRKKAFLSSSFSLSILAR